MPRSAASIQASLDIWYAARDAIANAQSYNANGRAVTKADLPEVNATIDRLERDLSVANSVSSGGNGFTRRAQLGGMGY